MIDQEPEIKVALLQNYSETRLTLNGRFFYRINVRWKAVLPFTLIVVRLYSGIPWTKKYSGKKKFC